jgi:hypothetical protein
MALDRTKNNFRETILEPYWSFYCRGIDSRFGFYPGGIRQFENLPGNLVQFLVDEQLCSLDAVQNGSPTVGVFLAFMKLFPKVLAHGYAVHPFRPDYGIIIEGLQLQGKISKKLQAEFYQWFRKHGHPWEIADSFTCNDSELRCWWD